VLELVQKKLEDRWVDRPYKFKPAIKSVHPADGRLNRFKVYKFDPNDLSRPRAFDKLHLTAGGRQIEKATW